MKIFRYSQILAQKKNIYYNHTYYQNLTRINNTVINNVYQMYA
jgi:hypothetical protein